MPIRWEEELPEDDPIFSDGPHFASLSNVPDQPKPPGVIGGGFIPDAGGGIISITHLPDEFDGDDPYPSLELVDQHTALVQYEAHGPVYVVDVDEALKQIDGDCD